MKFKALASSIFVMALSIPSVTFAAMQCGDFYLKADKEGLTLINGRKPQSQKITFTKAQDDYDNVMIQWMVPSPEAGRWLGMDYVRSNGKPILNVEVVRTNMNQPREFWSYDCVKVK